MKLPLILAGLALCLGASAHLLVWYSDATISVIVASAKTPTVNQPIVTHAGTNTSVVLIATALNLTLPSYV